MAVDAGAWTSRVNVKEYVGIDSSNTDKDVLIDRLVNVSYRSLESYIHRALKSATYTEYYDGDGTNTLVVRNYPINSITSIHDDANRSFGSDTLIPAADYVYDNNLNERVGVVRLFQGQGFFAQGIQNIKIIYNGGYDTIPADAEQACIMLVDWLLGRAATAGKTSETLGGKSEIYDPAALPLYIRQLVNVYKEYAC